MLPIDRKLVLDNVFLSDLGLGLQKMYQFEYIIKNFSSLHEFIH